MEAIASRLEAIATRNKKLLVTRDQTVLITFFSSSNKPLGWRPSLLVARNSWASCCYVAVTSKVRILVELKLQISPGAGRATKTSGILGGYPGRG